MDPSKFHKKSHTAGTCASATAAAEAECYDSTAFFVKELLTGQGKELLFFGDVEPGTCCGRRLVVVVLDC